MVYNIELREKKNSVMNGGGIFFASILREGVIFYKNHDFVSVLYVIVQGSIILGYIYIYIYI